MADSAYINCRQREKKNKSPEKIKIGTYKIEMLVGN